MDGDEYEMVVWEPREDLNCAIVGIGRRCGQDDVLVYDRRKLIQAFMDQGMTSEEASEWISFNIEGAYVGETTPIIMEPIDNGKSDSDS